MKIHRKLTAMGFKKRWDVSERTSITDLVAAEITASTSQTDFLRHNPVVNMNALSLDKNGSNTA